MTAIFSMGDSSGNSLLIGEIEPSKGQWHHILGTIDATAGATNPVEVLVDGVSVGLKSTTGTIPITSVPTDGTALYFGGAPGQTPYLGAVGDFGIWYGKAISSSNMITTFNQLVQGGHPVNPRFYTQSTALGLPSLFLSGPASSVINPQGQYGAFQGWFLGAGQLQDFNTTPL